MNPGQGSPGYVGERWGPTTAGGGVVPGSEDKIKDEVTKILTRHDKMESDRFQTANYWQDVYHYIIPRKRDVISTSIPGAKRNTDLFDTTAVMANHLLAGALHGMLTNPETRFFDLVMGDPKLDQLPEVKLWLQDVAERMFQIFQNSNFQTEVHEVYLDLGAIGTACMYIGDDDDRVVQFAARAMKEVYCRENNLGLIDIVHRQFPWKLRQIVLEFGEEALPADLLRKYKDGVEDDFTVVHAVEPQQDEVRKQVHAFQSLYILKEQKHRLSKKGYREFPYAVPRWTKTSGETYGRGPGMDMLPDIKMLNKMKETTLKGAQKTVDPPLMITDDGVIGMPRLTPGGLTVVRPGLDAPVKPLIIDARIDFGMQLIEKVMSQVRQGFYVDQLQLPEGPQQTATEVNARTEQMLRLMGPVLGRQNFEFLRPVVERVFGLMVRKGLVPKPPQAIQGRHFDVRYSSLVARAQRMSEGQNLARAIQALAPFIQMKPELMDIFDTDKVGRYYAGDVYGVPAKVMRGDRDIKQIRQARDQAHQQAAQDVQQQHQASVAGQVLPAVAQLQQAQNQAQKTGQGT